MSKPAAERQRTVAHSLGISFPKNITWGELHLLMLQANPKMLQNDPPTQSQLDWAARLGLEVESGTVTKAYLVALIEDTLEARAQEAMRDNPAIEVGNTIRYDGTKYLIKKLGTLGCKRWQAMLISVDGGGRRDVSIVDLVTAELVEPSTP